MAERVLLLDRLLSHSATDGRGCWVWLKRHDSKGYGRYAIAREGGWKNGTKVVQAHRLAYELMVGPIPEGLTLDHLCKNTACINPAHLEPVTAFENIMRGDGPPARNARKTVCDNGHPYTEENTFWRRQPNGRVWRGCRACKSLWNKDYERRRRAVQGRSDNPETPASAASLDSQETK